MRNIALLIEYDGTAYGGWQTQKNSASVQETIEKRLSGLLQEKINLTGAGRTDAGVHARGQVANFRTASAWEPGKIKYALNGTLPEDIAVPAAAEVGENFHSRFGAVSRRYSYSFVTGKIAIGRNFTAFFPLKVSVDIMNSAAAALIGTMDFKSFTKYAGEQRHFQCTVTSAKWRIEERAGEDRGGLLSAPVLSPGQLPVSVCRFEIEANRFLHGMVRAIVGTLLDVGRGKLTVDEFRGILDARDRKAASMSAPACGLCLEEVKYGFDVWGTANESA